MPCRPCSGANGSVDRFRRKGSKLHFAAFFACRLSPPVRVGNRDREIFFGQEQIPSDVGCGSGFDRSDKRTKLRSVPIATLLRKQLSITRCYWR